MNPYATPRASSQGTPPPRKWLRWRFFVYSLLLQPVWFFLSGAAAIGGSPEDEILANTILLIGLVLSAVTFMIGVGARSTP